jgi:hypothetical protein
MSYNDAGFSEFWASGASRGSIPASNSLRVGRHFGEDPSDRAASPSETIGYVVIESTNSGTIEGLPFVAGVGSDTVRGMTNGPSFDYTYEAMSNSKTAIADLAGMDGGDGGWAVLYGANPITPEGNTLRLAVDEDQLGDTDRGHTTEQVAYFIIDPPLEEGDASQADAISSSPTEAGRALRPRHAEFILPSPSDEQSDYRTSDPFYANADDTRFLSDAGVTMLAQNDPFVPTGQPDPITFWHDDVDRLFTELGGEEDKDHELSGEVIKPGIAL